MKQPIEGGTTGSTLTPDQVKTQAAVEAANAAVTTALNASGGPVVPAAYSPGNFRKAEEASNAPFYAANPDYVATMMAGPSGSDVTPQTRVDANDAKKAAGPPYTAPAGSHWTWIGTDYQLYKDAVSPNAGGGTGTGTGTGDTTLPATPTGPTLARDVFKQTLAIYFGTAETSKPWMDELYNLSAPLYKSGATMDEALNMALIQGRNNPALAGFTSRFQGLFALQDKKVSGAAINVPTIAEYYNAEAGMGAVLKQAGLGDIATSDYVGEIIGKGLSVTDVGKYINNIYTEIQNLPADIKAQVAQHYPGLDNVSLAKSILTGDKGFAQLQQDLNTFEVQAVGNQQGVSLNDMQARDLVGQGYDMGSATTGLSQVALDSPAYQRLQEISTGGKVTTAQAQGDLIDANMKKLASQRRKVEQAISAEQSRFQTTSGNIKNAPPHTFSESGAY